MSTFVLVHGAGSGGWNWRKVIPPLRAAGHRVYTPTLTGCGERAHLNRAGIGLETHILDVVGTLRWEELSEVVLVGHSYGGNVITGVAELAHDRLAQLVYLDANVPRDGESMVDLMGQDPRTFRERAADRGARWWRRDPAFPDLPAAEAPVTPELLAPMVERGLLTEADRDWLVRNFVPHPAQTYLDPVRLRHPAALALPRTYIYCTLTGGPFGAFAERADRTRLALPGAGERPRRADDGPRRPRGHAARPARAGGMKPDSLWHVTSAAKRCGASLRMEGFEREPPQLPSCTVRCCGLAVHTAV